MSRRNFMVKAGSAMAAFSMGKFAIPEIAEKWAHLQLSSKGKSLAAMTTEEDYWHQIKMMYTVSPSILNLNNGGVSPQPLVVQEAVERYNRLANEAPTYYMWRVMALGKEPLRKKLAAVAGVSSEEIAINRNASEALETVIFGLRLKAGDEVVLCHQDYPNMMNAWKQREHRDGLKLNWVNFKLPIENDEEIVDAYRQAITPQTKVLHVTHVINWMGQIMPVRKIANMAKEKGLEVIVDGAHSFAQLDFSIKDLNADYFGTSLHKWMSAPFGSGMLYVKKDKIKNLYPLFSWTDPEDESIKKFESLGTRSFAIEQAIGQAVDFHAMISVQRKEARLHYLKNYWAEKVVKHDRVHIGTSLDPKYGCAIGLLQVDGMEPIEVQRKLWSKYKIHTVAITGENVSGVRVTPNVYTVTNDLDRLVETVDEIVRA